MDCFSFWSATSRRRHDVFLSFRGEDTRRGILKTLHSALSEAGISTFKDDTNLEKGSDIAAELLKAIQMSRIAVVLFSRNYASSGWCLDELVKIVECGRVDGQVVVPVFYDVDPDDVRHRRGSFAQAFAAHEQRFALDTTSTTNNNNYNNNNKIDRWREALQESSSCTTTTWDLHKHVKTVDYQWYVYTYQD